MTKRPRTCPRCGASADYFDPLRPGSALWICVRCFGRSLGRAYELEIRRLVDEAEAITKGAAR